MLNFIDENLFVIAAILVFPALCELIILGLLRFKIIKGEEFTYEQLKNLIKLDPEQESLLKQEFPEKISFQNILKICEKLGSYNTVADLVLLFPFKLKKWVFDSDTTRKTLFYCGNIVAEENLNITNSGNIKGNLQVKKDLNLTNCTFHIHGNLDADSLIIKNSKVYLYGGKINIKRALIIEKGSKIYFNKPLKARTFIISDSSIAGDSNISVLRFVANPNSNIKTLSQIKARDSFLFTSSQLITKSLKTKNHITIEKSKVQIFKTVTGKVLLVNQNSEFSGKANVNHVLINKE